MNKLTSRQRKLAYAGGIIGLLIPIILLGAPTSGVEPGQKTIKNGGMLAAMRVKYDLGESTLGDIDPSSAALNLVLLGLRGPAAGVLHLKAIDYQEKKDWAKLKTTVDSIIKLQPHYDEIWKFQGWNLAFNVSREWDRVADRFYWVKDGIKFLVQGTRRNQSSTILFYNVGDFTGRKFGNSDEKRFFRKFFVDDPDDERWGENNSDTELNPEGIDNYLVANDWFRRTNEKDESYRIKGMTHVFARQGPARSLLDYASAIQDDGKFGEENRIAWDKAYKEWTDVYGNDIFLGINDLRYKLNCTTEDIEAMALENGVTPQVQQQVWNQNVKMTNFNFWRDFADCERDPLTVSAHKAIYDGKVAYAKGETSDSEGADGQLMPSKSEELFFNGMTEMKKVFDKYPQLSWHDAYVEEALLAIHYWQEIHKFNLKKIPEDYPLKSLFLANIERMPDIERLKKIESRTIF